MSFAKYDEGAANGVIDEMSRNNNPEATISKLSSEEADVCMRYIYKGLESGENSNNLLKWHELLTKKEGLGCIVRALTVRPKQTKKQEAEEDDE
eukprot:TRINITY_DN18576_c0_g1_i1.p1 TRINITY_DN18576_c0_g1~~TRINITY_DN18576_c0_g1_i1.p1  ORF type:complete len:94 (-),score=48.85 TRINITY_DN18576_c0_g1_i1:60-341(-)